MHSIDEIITGLTCRVPCDKCPYQTDGGICDPNLATKEAITILEEYRDIQQATTKALQNIVVNMSEVVHCKDCAHYEKDVMAFINNIPVIIAHDGCKAWGGPMGCKTDPEGWCHMGRRKETTND